MTSTPEDAEASLADVDTAVQNALAYAEITAEELIAAHKANDFPTLRARMAWVAVGGILLERHDAQESSDIRDYKIQLAYGERIEMAVSPGFAINFAVYAPGEEKEDELDVALSTRDAETLIEALRDAISVSKNMPPRDSV